MPGSATSPRAGFPFFSWWLWGFIGLLLWYSSLVSAIGDVNDLYWHARVGQDIWENNRLGGDPTWVYGPAGNPDWVTTQVLSELAIYGLWSVGGWHIFLVLRMLAILAFALASWQIAIRVVPKRFLSQGHWQSIALALSVYLFAVPLFMTERPQTVSILLFLGLSLILQRVLLAGKWPNVFATFAVVAAWGWIHGGALLVAPLMLGAWGLRLVLGSALRHVYPTLGETRWWNKPIPVILAAALGAAANPVGLNIYAQAQAIRDASERFISEWLPTTALSDSLVAFIWLAALWVVGAVLSAKAGLSLRLIALEGAWIVALFVLGAQAERFGYIASILVMPIAVRRFARSFRFKSQRFASLSGGHPRLAAVAILVATLASGIGISMSDGLPAEAPRTIMAGLAAENRDKYVVTAWNISGPLQLHSGAHTYVNIDGRTDRYGKDVMGDYFAMLDLRPAGVPMWRELEPLTTDVVVQYEQSGLVTQLLASGNWRQVCRDGQYVWLTKDTNTGACPSDIPERLPVSGL